MMILAVILAPRAAGDLVRSLDHKAVLVPIFGIDAVMIEAIMNINPFGGIHFA